MITRKRAALDGVWLDEVHEAVVIRSIESGDGKTGISAVSSAAGNGQRITGYRRDTLDVTVKFGIDIKRGDMEGRTEALEAVNAWAAAAYGSGAWLTVNYKPGRRIRVVLAQAPGEGSAWDWTKEYSIVFRAYGVPFWEDEEEKTADIGSGGALSGSFRIEGSAPAGVSVTLENISGAEIKRIGAVTVNGNTMGFTSLGLMAGEALVIDHGASGLLRIRIRSADGVAFRSAMGKRTPESADDFTALPGETGAGLTSERACRMLVGWRCRYL